MTRQFGAHVTPAAVMLGVGFHNCASCTYLLAQKAASSKGNLIWRVSVFTLLSVLTFLILQAIVLDFVARPYDNPEYWVGMMQLLNYAFHFVSAAGITIVMVLRLGIFYSKRSTLMKSIYLLGLLVFISKAIGDSFGILISYDVMNGIYLMDSAHPFYDASQISLGVSTMIDLLFSMMGSIGFLYALTVNRPNSSFFKDVIFHHDGYRLILIVVTHIYIASSAIYGFNFGHNHYSFVGYYLPSFVIAFELHTFLDLSYVQAKEIVMQQQLHSSKLGLKLF